MKAHLKGLSTKKSSPHFNFLFCCILGDGVEQPNSTYMNNTLSMELEDEIEVKYEKSNTTENIGEVII